MTECFATVAGPERSDTGRARERPGAVHDERDPSAPPAPLARRGAATRNPGAGTADGGLPFPSSNLPRRVGVGSRRRSGASPPGLHGRVTPFRPPLGRGRSEGGARTLRPTDFLSVDDFHG